MEQWIYFAALSFSLGGLAVLDWRFRLAFWYSWRAALAVLGIGLGVFLLWDAAGIALEIFHHGEGDFTLPYRLAPHFPVEELLFLTLLMYTALLLYRAGEKI